MDSEGRSRDGTPPLRAEGVVLAGRYRLERRLGAGGMGEVWSAHHLLLDRGVALKLIRVPGASVAARLLAEARALARVRHPGVVEVHDCGLLDDGSPYVVMERLAGETLAQSLARRIRLPAVEAAGLFLPILDALAAAHAAGVVHRDLKPDNVMLTDGGRRPVLIDFGIARLPDGAARRTAAGALMGTPAYMAPELFRGEPADERADLWGAAAALYECLTGQPPFGDDAVAVVMRRVLDAPLPYPRDTVEIDGRLWALLARGMRKQPAERFPSAAEMREALAAWLAQQSVAPRARATPVTDPALPASAHPAPAGATAAAPPPAPTPTPGPRTTPLDDAIRRKLAPR